MSTPLTTTDPAELANLARCFSSCVPVGLHMAMRTQQLNNVAVVVTNPVCSTPRSPTINAIPTDDTTAQVTWKSLPNSGSFITGWIVSWGTTSGGPYPNSSGVLPLVPRVYTATGLTPGTQYFFIVTAVTNIAGCTSNSPERSATTTGTNPGLLLSLVSYWKLDEAAGAVRADSIGANNVSQGADAVGQSTTAIIGDSAQFTLASAGLQAASNSTLQFAAGASKSFSGWFLTSTLGFTQALIGKWTDVGNDREYVLVTSGGTTTFRTRNLANGANVDVASTVTIAANTWHHVAFGYDNLNSVIWIQVDGETRVTTASTGVRSSGVQFRLGSCVDFNTTGSNGLDGFMDEWAMWSRVITNAEVQQLAASFSLPGIQATITAGSDNANRWNSKVQSDGGAALSAGTLTAFAACVDGMISDGTYSSILVFNSIPKDGLTAVLRPWSRIGNTFAAWTNHNFVAGDLTVNGLTGDGATKYLDTGFNASTQIQSQNNSSLALYAYTSNSTANAHDCSTFNAAVTSGYVTFSAIGGNSGTRISDIAAAATVAAAGNGYYCGSRTAANRIDLYFASSVSPHASIANSVVGATLALPNLNSPVFALNNNGVIANFCSATISSVIFATGLSSAQSQVIFNRLQTLRTAYGGGFR